MAGENAWMSDLTPAQQVMLDKFHRRKARKYRRTDPCPAEERVCGVVVVLVADVKSCSEGESTGDDGITRQKCGGGHRIVRKRIGGGS